MNTIAVYPGSFDPITNGHLDVIRRAAVVFDRVVVGVLANPRKTPAAPGRDADPGHPRRAGRGRRLARPASRSPSFDGLTVDFCRARGAGSIVRGLRAISDFETEMQLAHNNRVLAPDVDTVFFMTVGRERLRQLEPGQGDRRRSAATSSAMVPAAAGTALREALAEALTARPRAILAATRARDRSAEPGGHSDRHHLPRRAPRVADRQRQEAAAHDQRRRRPERGARPHRRAARRRARGGPRGQADQRRGRADHREGPGGGRADRRHGPGAGRLPHRRARADPAGRGRAASAIIGEAHQRRRRDPPRRRRVRGRACWSASRATSSRRSRASRRASPCSTSGGPTLVRRGRPPIDADDGGWARRAGGRGAAGPRAMTARPTDGPAHLERRRPAGRCRRVRSRTTPIATSASTSPTTSRLADADRGRGPAVAHEPRHPRRRAT